MISDLDKWLEELDAELSSSAPVQEQSLESSSIKEESNNSVPGEEITIMIDLTATPAAAEDVSYYHITLFALIFIKLSIF